MSKSLFTRAFSAAASWFGARPSRHDEPQAPQAPPQAPAPQAPAQALAPQAPAQALAPRPPAPSPPPPAPTAAAPEPPAKVRLFAGDVAVDRLPLSLSIETFGGVSTVLILRGTAAPIVRRETFSTATDGQGEVEVHVLVGDRESATDNVSVGKYSVVGIEPAPRGTPRIEVTFTVDAEGSFALTAKDTHTGRPQPVKVAGPPPPPLARADVEAMRGAARAEEVKGALRVSNMPDHLDSVKVETAKLYALIQSARAALKGNPSMLPEARLACEEELQRAERLLESYATPEWASMRLNIIKADALAYAHFALDEAARRCRRGVALPRPSLGVVSAPRRVYVAPPMQDSLATAVARALHPALPAAAGLTEGEVAGLLAAPPDPALGDFTFPCFKLAKALRKAPPQIATELAAALTAAPGLFAAAAATGPYVNLTLDLGRAAALVLPALARGESTRRPKAGVKVMVEYSQPNTHKAFHVGHMRNLCLGDSLVRLLRWAGDDVIAANYLGDVGAHIAKCLWWYLDRLADRTPPPDRRGEWLGELYAAASNQLDQWEEQAKAGDATAAAELARAKARTSEILHRLEAREPEMTAIWRETRQWSLDEFAEIYGWTGVHFDRIFYESEVDEPGLKLVEEFLQKGLFVVSQGAVGVDNPEIKHMPFFMLRKQDGTSLYSTKDLALARLKFEEYGVDRSIYVVDVRQSDHFKHVFLTLKKMGFSQAERCQHVAYEMVELPDGPMAGRKGNVVLFRSLRQQMTEGLRRNYFHKFEGEWPAEELAEAERAVALGAIKYGMLNRDVNQKIVFDLAAWLNLEGNTGPYLQYTCARATSIIDRCAEAGQTLDPETAAGGAATAERLAALREPQERELVVALDRMPGVLEAAAAQLRPSLVCAYAYDLCKAFNRFNKACRVKGSEPTLLQARLALVHAFVATLRETLSVLGITAPRRM